jgi:hypothetical protein
MIFLLQEKDLAYQIGYWVTAFLPVIIGFVATILIVWYLTKTYKEKDKDFDEEFTENNK